MFDFIFGFHMFREENQSWIFTIRHLGLFIFFILAMTFLWFLLSAKSQKGINRTKIGLAIGLFIFEIGRMAWRVARHMYQNDGSIQGHNWTFTWSFQICATMVWISIITLITSIYLKPDNKYLIVLKNILFGAASIGGLFTFVFPEHIHEDRYVFHWLNLQTIIQHTLIVFVPLYLIKIGEIKIKFKNIWMPALGFLGTTTIAMAAAHVTGDNFAMVLGHEWIENLSFVNFTHPWHLLFIFGLAFAGTFILYFGFFIIDYLNRKKKCEELVEFKKKNFLSYENVCLYIGLAVGIMVTFSTMFIPMWLGADYSQIEHSNRALNSPLGFLVMAPLIMLIVLIWYLDILITKNKNNN